MTEFSFLHTINDSCGVAKQLKPEPLGRTIVKCPKSILPTKAIQN